MSARTIHACNDTETTIETVDLWAVLDAARRYYISQATPKDITPEAFDAAYSCAIECLEKQRHIERMCNNGAHITLTTGF